MARNVFIAVVLILLIGGGYYYYHTQRDKAQTDGSIHWDQGRPTPEQEARFARENSGETPDGASEHKNESAKMAADEAATGATPAGFPSANATNQPPVTQVMTTSAAGAPPASDTVTPNPPNGMVFTGTGTYQWYRQGNLTWRVNTSTGSSCIVYATMEEWRKAIVMSHGCGNNA